MARFFGVPMRNGVALGVASTLPMRGGLPVPALNLDFLSGDLDSRITFTRGSTATFFDSTGTLQSAAINAARFDYNPSTLAPLGLLIEEQRTNSIRNNTMQGAVAGTPGTLPTNWSDFYSGTGVTRTIVGTGTENGITYVDIRLSGTPSATATYELSLDSNVAAAAVGQSWTVSTYGKLQAGSTSNLTVRIGIIESNSGGAYLTEQNFSVTPTSAALNTQRTTGTRTLSSATVAFVRQTINFVLTASAAIDITLRIGLPQLEQGAFATSVIPTTTTALTRNADVASMTGTNFSAWFNASEGTVVVSSIPSNVTATNVGNWAIGDSTLAFGAANTIYNLYTSGLAGRIGVNAITAGAAQVSNLTPSYTQNANTLTKSATAYKLNDYAHSVNGIAPATDTSATVPTVTSMSIGGLQSGWSGATNYLNGYIQRIAYYPRRLPNSTLQALTA